MMTRRYCCRGSRNNCHKYQWCVVTMSWFSGATAANLPVVLNSSCCCRCFIYMSKGGQDFIGAQPCRLLKYVRNGHYFILSKKDSRPPLTMAGPHNKGMLEPLVHSLLLSLAAYAINVVYRGLQWCLVSPSFPVPSTV